jgi:hypothetical protein
MSGSKRKGRASPEVIESDDEERASLEPRRRMDNDRETSQRRRRSISNGEGYPNDERENMRVRAGVPRPGVGGYRPHVSERRPPVDYEGRYNPGFFQYGPSSSRGPYRCSRSPEPYGKPREGGSW